MKYFKKIMGERVYLSPRSVEDKKQYIEAVKLILDFGFNYLNLNNI